MGIFMSIKSINHEFYESAYLNKNIFGTLLKQFFSYDQLNKARRNLAIAKKIPQFSKKISVLDYGFGYGTFLLRMPRRHSIFGCELSAAATTNLSFLCSILGRKVDFFSQEQFIENSLNVTFDLIVCSHVIEHVEDDMELLLKFRQVMSKDGYLLLNLPINEVWKDPKHVRAYSVGTATSLLNKSGFEVDSFLETDRWSAWILYFEYVSKTKILSIFRFIRLFFALLPTSTLNAMEIFLPRKFCCQQLIILAKIK